MTECDYCDETVTSTHYLRAIGWANYDGNRTPLVKVWCGDCEPNDNQNPDALAALHDIARTWEGQQA